MMQFPDLKSQIERNELIHGIRSSAKDSLCTPKWSDFFKESRRLNLQVLMNIYTGIQLQIEAVINIEKTPDFVNGGAFVKRSSQQILFRTV